MPNGFSNNEKHKIEAFPAGEGADQRMRREADEGYAKTASFVKEHPFYLREPLKILRTAKRRNLFRHSSQKFFAEDELCVQIFV